MNSQSRKGIRKKEVFGDIVKTTKQAINDATKIKLKSFLFLKNIWHSKGTSK
jgi:hypothetical protein